MGNKNPGQNTDDKKSISSVNNLSLDSNKDNNSNTLINENIDNLDNISDIVVDLKSKVSLPTEKENEYIESSEFLLDQKEEELKIKYFFENNDDDIIKQGLFNRKRSKTFIQKINIKNTPKPHPMESNEYISPLKLSIKSYGHIPKWNKKPNAVLYDFQKNLIDCKSCNDENSFDDFYLYDAETERNTPNVEDLQNLLNCRKIMTIFRNSLNERNFKEYENILDSDYIFNENNKNNVNNHHQKKNKNNFWYKHIKLQQLKEKNKDKDILHTQRLYSEPIVNGFETIYEEDEDKKDHGLFILGILESAANERKGRKTTNV